MDGLSASPRGIEAKRARQKRAYQRDREPVLARRRDHYAENREAILQRKKERRHSQRLAKAELAKLAEYERLGTRAVPGDEHVVQSVGALFSQQLGTCRICGFRPTEAGEREEHLERHRRELLNPARSARGSMNRRPREETRRLAAELLDRGLMVGAVAAKLGISTKWLKRLLREG